MLHRDSSQVPAAASAAPTSVTTSQPPVQQVLINHYPAGTILGQSLPPV